MAPRDRASTKAELEHALQIRRIDRTAEILRYAIKYGSYTASTYFISMAARAFAGQATLVDFAANVITSLNANQWAAWVLAGICGVGWVRQRKVHHDLIERFAPLNRAREEALDPARSSSGLTARGDTHPGDRR
jgi:hypothetical protein